ncbi:hypothetical protein EBU94_07705 [bacterium]|nr:hypothetical protein [bacterium]
MTINGHGCIMSFMLKARKKRCDRNHVIYFIENLTNGDQYIGLTALSYNGNVYKTLRRRMQKHLQRALKESKDWGLCEALRHYGPESFVFGKLEIIRGKKQAHSRETELIGQLNPALNTLK